MFADLRQSSGKRVKRQDMRSLGAAKTRASKEGYDEQQERSNLVNIMSGMVFPMCYLPTIHIIHTGHIPVTCWEFWF